MLQRVLKSCFCDFWETNKKQRQPFVLFLAAGNYFHSANKKLLFLETEGSGISKIKSCLGKYFPSRHPFLLSIHPNHRDFDETRKLRALQGNYLVWIKENPCAALIIIRSISAHIKLWNLNRLSSSSQTKTLLSGFGWHRLSSLIGVLFGSINQRNSVFTSSSKLAPDVRENVSATSSEELSRAARKVARHYRDLDGKFAEKEIFECQWNAANSFLMLESPFINVSDGCSPAPEPWSRSRISEKLSDSNLTDCLLLIVLEKCLQIMNIKLATRLDCRRATHENRYISDATLVEAQVSSEESSHKLPS